MAVPSIFVEHKGEMVCLNELSTMTGLNVSTLTVRYRNGLRGEDLIVPPHHKKEEQTPQDLTLSEVEELRRLAFFSEGQQDHWKIMCDLAGINRKFAKEMKKVLDA